MNDATKDVADGASPASAPVQNDLDAMLAAAGAPAAVPGQRCGVIAIVGKPNVGKSTLLNALVGQKISITSRKAQTTRHRITGIRTREQTQFVFVDTPGFQTRHATALNKSLNKTVMGAIGDVDLILFVVEAGSFTLANPLQAGAYEYILRQGGAVSGGQSWYLTSTYIPPTAPTTPTTATTTTGAIQWVSIYRGCTARSTGLLACSPARDNTVPPLATATTRWCRWMK